MSRISERQSTRSAGVGSESPHATAPTQLIYAAALIAALARIFSAFGWERDLLLHTSASAWVLAFAGFAITYGPLLTRPRRQITEAC